MNVIFILVDQLSAKWLGCYGNPAAYTPNIDKLAARSAQFDNCYSNNPICMPARASIITGRSAQHNGVFCNGDELGTDIITYPEVLQSNKVQTFGIGKFHLECHGRGAYNDVSKYGFERAETTEDIRCGDWLDWVQNTHPEHYEQALSTVWYNTHLQHYGSNDINLLPLLEAANKKYPRQFCAPTVIPEKVCQTRWITDRAIDFINERDSKRPFFINISYVDPHDPYDPPARFLELIDRNAIPYPIKTTDGSLQDIFSDFAGQIKFFKRFSDCDEEQWITMRHHYLASLAFLDEQIGRLLKHLDATGLTENSRIIFSADHGDMLGDHGYPTKGAWHFDACSRIPLLISGNSVIHKKYPQMVSTIDLFPTIIDCANIDLEFPIEGKSLLQLVENSKTLDRPDAVLVETYGSCANTDYALTAKSVMTRNARYTRLGSGHEMLFDLIADPHESKNLAAVASEQSHKAELQTLMLDLLSRQNIPLPSRNRHPFANH
jgi:arylsulfatase A-like enzyme